MSGGEISERCFLKLNYMKEDAKTLKEYIKVLREEKEIAKRQVKLSYKGQHYESPQNSDLRLAAISFALNAVEFILENDKRNVQRGQEKSCPHCGSKKGGFIDNNHYKRCKQCYKLAGVFF